MDPSPSGTPASASPPQDRLSAAPVTSESHPGAANKETFVLVFSYIIQWEKHTIPVGFWVKWLKKDGTEPTHSLHLVLCNQNKPELTSGAFSVPRLSGTA